MVNVTSSLRGGHGTPSRWLRLGTPSVRLPSGEPRCGRGRQRFVELHGNVFGSAGGQPQPDRQGGASRTGTVAVKPRVEELGRMGWKVVTYRAERMITIFQIMRMRVKCC